MWNRRAPCAELDGAATMKSVLARRIPVVIGVGVAAILLLGGALVWRAEARTNKVNLASSPKPVTASPAESAPY